MAQFKKFIKKKLPTPLVHVIKAFNLSRLAHYADDGIMTSHYPDTFMKDPRFVACYDSAVRAGLAIAEDIHWRAHTIVWAAMRGKALEGDFVECGVHKGFLSKIAMDYIDFRKLPKTFFLVDTYEGLVEKYLTKEEKEMGKTGGGYESCYGQVVDTFNSYTNVKLVKGSIPDILPEVMSKNIAYLSIDMNCVLPEIAAAEYFWHKLVPGAAIIS